MEYPPRLGPTKTILLAIGAAIGAALGVVLMDRAIHFARR